MFDRPYASAPYFWGNDVSNEIGNHYGVITAIHVCFGLLSNLLPFIPLWITSKGFI